MPAEFDARQTQLPVLQQEGQTAVGYSIAAVMDRLRSARGISEPVSPLMLYQLGKRYDPFPPDPPDEIVGTTVEAAMRGLRLHGVCTEAMWRRFEPKDLTDLPSELAVDAAQNRPAEIVQVPLDIASIQAALVRDGPLVMSSVITRAWEQPVVRHEAGRELVVIDESPNIAQPMGGHAFVLAGYNAVGFLVQNAWGPSWGKHGYATWPYASVLSNAYQVWAIRLFAARSSLAGYQSDGVLGVDRLGITPDVKAIATLITARAVKPPLAFGLFGDWGSGKSFFMERLQEEVADRARVAQGAGISSPFCPNVVQIEFNAWHYLDANLWASLVSEILEKLFKAVSATPSEDDVRATIERELGNANGLFSQSQLELTAARQRSEAAAEALGTSRTATSAVQLDRGQMIELARTAVGQDPVVREQVRDLAAKVGNPSVDDLLVKLQQPIAEARTWPARLRRLWAWLASRFGDGPIRDRLRRALSLVAIVVIPTAAAIVAAGIVGLPSFFPVATAAVTLVIGLGPYVAKVGALIGAFERASAEIEAAERANVAKLQAEQQARRDAAVAGQAAAEERVRLAVARVEELESNLDDLAPARQVQRLLEERTTSQAYSSRLGLVSLIRRDFERLSDLLEERESRIERERKSAEASGASPEAAHELAAAARPGEIPLDRIVLYIDDLDRCKPARVIEILEAVHLLLAFRLFVVVVAVDPRWLRRCLEDQYPELLSSRIAPSTSGSDGLTRTSTPQDYLEKIFQIPFYLRPIRDQGFVELVGDLVGADVAEEFAGRGPDGRRAPGPPSTPPPGRPGAAVASGTSPSGPAAAVTDVQPPTMSDLDIERLIFNRWEVEDMQRLSPLFRTPRATKRFVNTYRLIRSTVEAGDRPLFEGTREAPGTYRNALLLLSVVAGYPNVAPRLLLRLAEASKEPLGTWASFVTKCQGSALDPVDDGLGSQQEWQDLCEGLDRIGSSQMAPRKLSDLRPWIPKVARYSFSVSLPGALDELLQAPVPETASPRAMPPAPRKTRRRAAG